MKKIILLSIALLLFISLINFVNGEVDTTSPEYLEVLGAFNDEEWVFVIVRLEDNSNIEITGTKEERRDLINQRDEWFKSKIDGVLSTLSEDEIGDTGKLSTGFGGTITRRGFDKLVNDPRIKSISLVNVGAQGALDDAEKLGVSDGWLWFLIIFVISVIILFLFINQKCKTKK